MNVVTRRPSLFFALVAIEHRTESTLLPGDSPAELLLD